MKSILNNIKNKYNLKQIFDFITFEYTLKLTKGSKKLSKELGISINTYKKIIETKKILKPSYNIKRYLNYFDIENNNIDGVFNLDKKIIVSSLNFAPFNIPLYIGNSGWEYIIQNYKNIKLVISPYFFSFVGKEGIENIYHTINLYKNNITEISFVNYLVYYDTDIFKILEKIFKNETTEKNIINRDDNQYIKKLSFEYIATCPVILSQFLDRLDSIISLAKIEELIIDANSLNEEQFSDFIQYISSKMGLLKNLVIQNYNFSKNNYVDFYLLCNKKYDMIEKLDLSRSMLSIDILSLLNNKKYPLKELKLNIYNLYGKTCLDFLKNCFHSLEVFEIEIKETQNYYINQLFYELNKIEKLKKLKIKGPLQLMSLNNFDNYENLEFLGVYLTDYYFNDNYDTVNEDYFCKFKKLKTLIISDKKYSKTEFKFVLPPNLTTIHLINIKGKLLELLGKNKDILKQLEDIKIENYNFEDIEFLKFIELFNCFKSLKKLSLNHISEYNSSFYEKMPSILEKIPTIIELDISNNYYQINFFESKIFDKIKLALPKKLLSLKIFNSNIPISQKNYYYILNLFGTSLDVENNYPLITQEINPLQKAQFNGNNNIIEFYN